MNIDQSLHAARNRMLTQRVKCKTLFLATQSSDGLAEASHAPCLYYENSFWLFISSLTAHTRNIQRTGVLGALIIEPESDTGNAFARRRQSLQCEARIESRDSPRYDTVLTTFSDTFGETVDVMRQLSDFSLYRLTPISGRYIEGFGKAFELSGENLSELSHIGPDQIQAESKEP